MKIIVERSVLLKALGHTNSVVERRNTIPILSNVLLRAEEGRLTLIATDLDIQITENIEAQVEQAGSTTVMSGTLFDIVRKMPEGSQVQLATAGNQVTISAGRSRFKLNVLPTDDFPLIATGDLPYEMEISSSQLAEMISDTRFAMSTEETRYYLNGIFFHVKDGMLRAAATDGHRLSVSAVAYKGVSIPDIIIPRKTIGEIAKLLGEVEGDLQIHLSNSKIRFDLGQVVLTSKLVDGTYPDYSRVIPTGNDKVMTTSVNELSAAADRVSIVSTDKTRAIKVQVGRDAVTLVVNSPEHGNATEEVAAQCANELEIGFNAKYLQDILGHISTEEVEFHFNDASSPVLVRNKEARSTEREKTMIIMPMRC